MDFHFRNEDYHPIMIGFDTVAETTFLTLLRRVPTALRDQKYWL